MVAMVNVSEFAEFGKFGIWKLEVWDLKFGVWSVEF